jgi:hypothetical protein
MSEQVEHSGPSIAPRIGAQIGPQIGPMYRASRDDEALDPGSRRLLIYAGGVVIVASALFGAFHLVAHSGGGSVPVIQAASGPVRVKPDNPGGMVVGPEEKQYNPNDSHLAPPVEEPNPRGLMAAADPSKAPVMAPVAPPRARPVLVQLSMTKSEAAAQGEWDKLAKKLPDVMSAHRPLFQKTNETGATPWHLRTGGFSDQAQAKAFCDKVKAKGGQCSIIDS